MAIFEPVKVSVSKTFKFSFTEKDPDSGEKMEFSFEVKGKDALDAAKKLIVMLGNVVGSLQNEKDRFNSLAL